MIKTIINLAVAIVGNVVAAVIYEIIKSKGINLNHTTLLQFVLYFTVGYAWLRFVLFLHFDRPNNKYKQIIKSYDNAMKANDNYIESLKESNGLNQKIIEILTKNNSIQNPLEEIQKLLNNLKGSNK
jgi:hypothetical protein